LTHPAYIQTLRHRVIAGQTIQEVDEFGGERSQPSDAHAVD
jgi:hypothetical protein